MLLRGRRGGDQDGRKREKKKALHRFRNTGSTTVVTKRKAAKLSSAGAIVARHNLATSTAYITSATRRIALPSPQPSSMFRTRNARATRNVPSCTASAVTALTITT